MITRTIDLEQRQEFFRTALSSGFLKLEGEQAATCGTNQWLDLLTPLLDPLVQRAVGALLAHNISPYLYTPFAVGGVGYEGLLLMSCLRAELRESFPDAPISYFGIRTSSTPREPQRPVFGTLGESVGLLSGVVLTGKTTQTARELVQNGGSEVVLCLSIIDRRPPQQREGTAQCLYDWSEVVKAFNS